MRENENKKYFEQSHNTGSTKKMSIFQLRPGITDYCHCFSNFLNDSVFQLFLKHFGNLDGPEQIENVLIDIVTSILRQKLNGHERVLYTKSKE